MIPEVLRRLLRDRPDIDIPIAPERRAKVVVHGLLDDDIRREAQHGQRPVRVPTHADLRLERHLGTEQRGEDACDGGGEVDYADDAAARMP